MKKFLSIKFSNNSSLIKNTKYIWGKTLCQQMMYSTATSLLLKLVGKCFGAREKCQSLAVCVFKLTATRH